ncbi:MAG TPA: MarR family transcriptional regulator [Oligoflexus sp.]|uniref:MarR family winged helix-turn-helix transcriptional regulator n=1 Tax=Oligoflexus sp. TaxID=1971216 RepID=UPI002D7EA05F|nr:MarR family transcriptional regulator [Oligoflexus sp.]HET9236941.1 MarR family transcriptional regulator [Oligoflexus sp.]
MSQDDVVKIRKLYQTFSFVSIRMHEAIGRKAGLSGTDHKYLGFLIQKGQMTAGELAVLCGLTTGAITGMIDRFEKKGLVQRQPSPDDRRKVIIVPDKARIMELLSPLYQNHQAQIEGVISRYTEAELKLIERFLGDLISVIHDTTAEHKN